MGSYRRFLARFADLESGVEVHGNVPYLPQEENAMPLAVNRRKSIRETKRERMELRVGASAKKLIQRAMAVTGLTAGDLAYEGARRALDEHERLL